MISYQELIEKTKQSTQQLRVTRHTFRIRTIENIETILGMLGEATELLDVLQSEQFAISFINTIDFILEAGDFYWYFYKYYLDNFDIHEFDVEAIYEKILLLQRQELTSKIRAKEIQYQINSLFISVGKLSENIKKTIMYNQTIPTSVNLKNFKSVAYDFYKLLVDANIPLEGIKKANKTKLLKRYPEGFTQEQAKERG